MDEDYTGFEIYKQVMRAYDDEKFAVWCCETFPWGAFDMARERVVFRTLDLADFRHYPPARHSPVPASGLRCLGCGRDLAEIAYSVLGGKDGDVWAAYLDPDCKRIAQAAQKERRGKRPLPVLTISGQHGRIVP